ncbi:hypothetical protein IFR05_006835 [Cadophora sp. M221]|nr:hypothetical protein IFR05_006835 [Cadophora sp. M221]
MRLLHSDDDGNLSLTEFFESAIPNYAILSHRWGTDEVTFKDMADGTSKSKTGGYSKIQFCGEQAKRDDLKYFWVDTCCIDKSSSTELSEAINSMFRWYQKAAKCYVYLSDVSIRKRKASDTSAECTWEFDFRASKWFTRGWTLQELLAPRSVEFFSREGNQIGNKSTLEQQIHEITRVPIMALRDNPLSQFNVSERFSWAKSRHTTREEDKAYSLFGIFDIQLPLLYGEGEVKAFQRLREEIDKPLKGSKKDLLRYLPYADEAPFNAYDRQDEPACLPNTRVGLLQEIYDWTDGKYEQDERCIFWLSGLAGTGKSTISRTVARRCSEQKRLGASFFFSKGGEDVSHAGKFFTSLAVQLANAVPSLRTHICDTVRKRSNIASLSLLDQWRELVIRPLKLVKLDEPSSSSSYLLIIDALDECDNEGHVRTIIQLLAEARSLTTVRLQVFLTSRPEVPIRHSICAIPQSEHQDFVLHDIQPAIINYDISLFLGHHLGIIGQEWTLGSKWPGDKVLRQLVVHASGLFIWAATACRFIKDGEEFAEDRLDEILKGTSFEGTPEQHLDQIYITVLQSSIPTTFRPLEKVRLCTMQRIILGSIVILLSPLSAASLAKVIGISGIRVTQTLERLQAILNVPKGITGLLRLHHPSFRDFLLNKDRCGVSWVDEKEAHQRLATSCIQLMSQTLKKDICDMHAPGTQASQVDCTRLQECLPPEVQYACLYWVQHLQRSGAQASDGEEACQFLQAHLLHWLEALGWMGKTLEGIQAILSLDSHIQATKSPNWHAFIYDIKRFVLYNRLAIEQAPLQLYCSALVFAPGNSIVRRNFEGYIPDWIQLRPKVQAHWNAALQTLEGHTGWVRSVAFSPDSKQVISGSGDRTVRLWDAATGAALQTLEGHTGSVSSVAFSPDSKQVVSGSDDGTVRLWDAATGAALQTLEGYTSLVSSVAFSPNGKQVISGSGDWMMRLWDVATGAVLQTFKGHISSVSSVAFSPDGKQVISGSGDRTVRLWDAATGVVLQTLEGHTSSVSSVAFSLDGKKVVSGSEDKTVQLWDSTTGAVLQTLKGHISSVKSVAFSTDNKQVVSGSDDRTVRLWDAATGAALQTLEGHTGSVSSVAFSPDSKQIVSGSVGRIVRLWDATVRAALQTLAGHTSSVSSVAFSPDGKQVVSGSDDGTVRLWDSTTGAALQTLKGHTSSVSSVAFSPDGKLVTSGSDDETVRLWDTATGAALQTLEGHTSWVSSVAFSSDSKQVVSGSGDETVRLWDTATGAALQTLKGHTGSVKSVAFSPDGKQIVSGSGDRTIRLWDVTTGAALQTLEGYTNWISSVAFSLDGKQVVSGSNDGMVRLWDATTGVVLQTLEGHTGSVSSVAFSPDGKLLPILQVSDHWILEGGTNILWLPPDYRQSHSATWNGNLVIGDSSGRMSFFCFEKGVNLVM